MFEFLKKKRASAKPADALQKSISLAQDAVKLKWIQFHQSIHLREDIPLATKIDLFAQPVREFLKANYPDISRGPAEVFWLIVFTAVIESGTHPTDDVNTAIAALRYKYAPAPREASSQSVGGDRADAPSEKLRAPISAILPSFLPVLIERGVPGYESARISLDGEKRLTHPQLRALLAASAYLGTLEHAGRLNFDWLRVRDNLTQTLLAVPDLDADEKACAQHLIDSFLNCKIIRENHPFDDWLCEVWWPEFQTVPYAYPSAMANVVVYGLEIQRTLRDCVLED